MIGATDSEVHILAKQTQKQADIGIGWSDEGIAKYNKIYDLVHSDCQLRGVTLNHELLKVHQRRRQKNKKTTDRYVGQKSESLVTT